METPKIVQQVIDNCESGYFERDTEQIAKTLGIFGIKGDNPNLDKLLEFTSVLLQTFMTLQSEYKYVTETPIARLIETSYKQGSNARK